MYNSSVIATRRPFKSLLALVTVFIVAAGMLSCGGVTGSSGNNNPSNNPPAASNPKVVIVVEENKAYTDVVGNPVMPYLNSLATQYALATNYFANDQPSLPNYFMLTTGQTVIQHTDTYNGVFDGDNVVRVLTAAGKTWRVYAENLPSVGYLGGDQPPYIQHHNPFVLFSDVVNSPTQQQNVVPVTQLATDLAAGTLPDYSFVVPNNQNNSHDCPGSMPKCTMDDTLANSDTWLQTTIGPLLNDSKFLQDGLIVITYDESNPNDLAHGGGHVATVVAGGKVKRGFQSTTLYQHESVLRFALKYLGVTQYPAASATAPDMDEFLNP